MAQVSQNDVEYVDVRPGSGRREPTNFYESWLDQSSAKHASPELIAADALRRLYPGHSLVMSVDHRISGLFLLPGITIHTSDIQAQSKQVSAVVFTSTSERSSGERTRGSLSDRTIFGSHKFTWNKSDFVVYVTEFLILGCSKTAYYILHDGPEQPARDLVLAVFLYAEQTHDEIWVFNQYHWQKSKALWLRANDSSWDDVVMKEKSKKALQDDVYGFFQSESTYKKLSVPWKRGLIMYGPPGNGKTASIKVIMKTCVERGITPLYIKSFQGVHGDEVGMEKVFLKARQLAPCVMILEDLDSLINDRNRSFFLNQLDGLEGNDGLLVIATTNHFDRLDPGLSNRPSRFDRKYFFDDPDHEERTLYAKYWQQKLKDNKEISFPESVVKEVVDTTQGFSFAYLKEAFVATLSRMTGVDDDKRVAFSVVLKDQISALSKELGGQSTPHSTAQPRSDGQVLHLTQRLYGPSVPSDVSQGSVLHAPPSAYPEVMPGWRVVSH